MKFYEVYYDFIKCILKREINHFIFLLGFTCLLDSLTSHFNKSEFCVLMRSEKECREVCDLPLWLNLDTLKTFQAFIKKCHLWIDRCSLGLRCRDDDGQIYL